jgi:hypothetical protein
MAQLCPRPDRVVQLAAAICLAPGKRPSEEATKGGEELRREIWRLRRELDELLTPAVLTALKNALSAFKLKRDEYRKSAQLWLDLIEDLSLSAEQEWGSQTGPIKRKQVESAAYQILLSVLEGQDIPGVPSFLEPLWIRLFARGTVEFVVSLVNHDDRDLELWRNEAFPPGPAFLPRQGRRARCWLETLAAGLVERFVAWYFEPSRLPPVLQRRVDEVVKDLHKGGDPLKQLVTAAFRIARFIGRHKTEMQHAVQAIATALKLAADFVEATREQRLEWVREAILLTLADQGFSGALLQSFLRGLLDVILEPVLGLYQRRGMIVEFGR